MAYFLSEIIKEDMPDVVQSVMYAEQFLDGVADMPKKNGRRDAVADYIVDELVINRVCTNQVKCNIFSVRVNATLCCI